ncbi:MAG: GyrI-like domain-containing protein [Bacteroidetes bacterium]|nr:MAG: GyrI-like domain-containing protein [Bacteroidota bacterium]
MNLPMTMANNQIFKLWSSFMPRRKEITNAISSDLFAMQDYDSSVAYENIQAQTLFTAWAAVEVSDLEVIPDGMEDIILEPSTYVVFLLKGQQKELQHLMQHIYTEWLPNSKYQADTRVMFQVMGPKYKNNDLSSEEEVWVPVKLK